MHPLLLIFLGLFFLVWAAARSGVLAIFTMTIFVIAALRAIAGG